VLCPAHVEGSQLNDGQIDGSKSALPEAMMKSEAIVA
jgi:hypothetical protein